MELRAGQDTVMEDAAARNAAGGEGNEATWGTAQGEIITDGIVSNPPHNLLSTLCLSTCFVVGSQHIKNIFRRFVIRVETKKHLLLPSPFMNHQFTCPRKRVPFLIPPPAIMTCTTQIDWPPASCNFCSSFKSSHCCVPMQQWQRRNPFAPVMH